MGQLGIQVFSEEIQDKMIENYIFNHYTKNFSNMGDFNESNVESVQLIIREAIDTVKQETSYSDSSVYIMDGYVTDDGYIAIDINISDNSNSGEVIKQYQALYDSVSRSIKSFPEKNSVTNSNHSKEYFVIKNAISMVEEKSGYIEGSPIYEAYENE